MSLADTKTITVVGAGSWGSALAVLLARNKAKVKLWARSKEIVESITEYHENRKYLPGVAIPKEVEVGGLLKESVESSEMVFLCVPSEFFREILGKEGLQVNNQIVVSTTKGIEHTTGKRMSEIVEEVVGAKAVVLSGPTHAEEVGRGMPTACVVSSENKNAAKSVAEVLVNQYFKVYLLNDVAGVEICGALKNITALAVGACDGFGLGDNARASMITLGLYEMGVFCKSAGAKVATTYSLAGVGDLIATCTSKYSRNRFFGECLAKGKSVSEVKKLMNGMVAEGVPTTKAVFDVCRGKGLQMELVEQTYKVLYQDKVIKVAMSDLLNAI